MATLPSPVTAARAKERESELLPIPRFVALLPAISGTAAILTGAVVAVGWVMDSRVLTQVSPSLPAMKFNTAVCMMACGATMILRARGRAPGWAAALSVFVLVVALATLFEWVFGVSLGIDQLLVSGPLHRTAPGRPAPQTALVLCLLAGALITLDSPQQRLNSALVISTAAVALMTTVGYLYDANALRGATSPTGVALQGLVALLLLAAGLIAKRIDRPPASILLRRDAAGQLARRLLPAALLVPLLLGFLRLLGQEAGLYDTRYGLALFAWSMMVVFSFLVLRTARAVGEREDAQRMAEGALAKASAEVDKFFALSLDLMAIANADGHFVRINPAAEQMLGYDIEELTTHPFTDFIHPDDLQATQETYERQAAGGEVIAFENRYRCKDGSYRWLLWSAGAIDDGFVYATARDVTERRQIEENLRTSREQAIEASRMKSEFLASMSHELRTPLNGVIGMTDLLRVTPLDPVQGDYVDAMGASGEALLAVISAVLDFSKGEAGHLELDRSDFELRWAVEEATQMLAEQAHSKGLEINHWVDPDVPLTVWGDRARLRQILLNLLSNAVKFTASGEVTLRVCKHENDQLRFSVSDTGVGINAGQASILFDAFTQADQSTTRRYGGTGLGLAISRQLVELMGGQIGTEPRERGGSTFWFAVELPPVESAARAARSRPDLQGLRTLVVDDNATNRTILEQYTRDWGLACESVDRASSAIEVLERASRDGQPFELAVLDFNMPEANGMELAREIRKRPVLGALRLLILSSAPLQASQLEGLGISASLIKPARQAAIYEAITDAFASAPARVAPEPRKTSTTVGRGLLVLVAEDNEINRKVAQALLAKLGLQTAVAHNGREAIEMATGYDYDAILMDCLMPEVDGFQATRQIREAENDRHVPIIAMTALSMPGDRERCLAAGMDDYLSKPVRHAALETVVRRWLPVEEPRAGAVSAGSGERRDAAAPSPRVEEVLDQTTILQLRETLTPDMRRELIDKFEEQQERCVADITEAVRRGDSGEVRRLAHLLKGSSASLGASRLRLCCQRLEHLGRGDDPDVGEAQIEELRGDAVEAGQALREQLA